MKSNMPRLVSRIIVVVTTLSLSACTQSALRVSPDFGNAVNQDVAAQITDPDTNYNGTPPPEAGGVRVVLAQKRYQTNTVIQPSSVTASSSASIGRADNGASSGDAGVSTTGAGQ
jgi:hypothetical protein